MTIQIKDLAVVRKIEVSEMSAVRGGVGGKGLSAGIVMDCQAAIRDTLLNEFAISDGYSFGASNPA